MAVNKDMIVNSVMDGKNQIIIFKSIKQNNVIKNAKIKQIAKNYT